MNTETQIWGIGEPLGLTMPDLHSHGRMTVLMANAGLPVRSQKDFRDKNGKVDLAKLFQAQNEATGLARRK